jgi:hypothetical protein
MPLVDPDSLGSEALTRIFLAPAMADARQVEAVLDRAGIEYAVQPEAYGRTLFGSRRMGAVFSVRAGQAEYTGALLVAAGLGWGVLIDVPGR